MAEGVGLTGQYLGMNLSVSDIDVENLEFFRWLGNHDFRLQACTGCSLVRYPPTTACPWCADDRSEWRSVEPRGVVYSYFEVHHAIQPQFREALPYHVLLVELDTQRGEPSADEALRIVANLTDAAGKLAPPQIVAKVGIGTRVKMVYVDVGEAFAIPQFTVDDDEPQPAQPWRYAQE